MIERIQFSLYLCSGNMYREISIEPPNPTGPTIPVCSCIQKWQNHRLQPCNSHQCHKHYKKGLFFCKQIATIATSGHLKKREHDFRNNVFYYFFGNENAYARQLNAGGQEEQIGLLGHSNIIPSQASLTEPGHWYWQNNTIYLYSAADPNVIDVKIVQLETDIYSAQKDFSTMMDS